MHPANVRHSPVGSSATVAGFFRRLFCPSARLLAGFALFAGVATGLRAGPLDSILGGHSLLVDIAEDTGEHWSVDFGHLFTVDQSTGGLQMLAPGSALVEITPIPEPTTSAALLGAASLAVAVARHRRAVFTG